MKRISLSLIDLAVAQFCKYYNHLGLDEVNRLNQ